MSSKRSFLHRFSMISHVSVLLLESTLTPLLLRGRELRSKLHLSGFNSYFALFLCPDAPFSSCFRLDLALFSKSYSL